MASFLLAVADIELGSYQKFVSYRYTFSHYFLGVLLQSGAHCMFWDKLYINDWLTSGGGRKIDGVHFPPLFLTLCNPCSADGHNFFPN